MKYFLLFLLLFTGCATEPFSTHTGILKKAAETADCDNHYRLEFEDGLEWKVNNTKHLPMPIGHKCEVEVDAWGYLISMKDLDTEKPIRLK